MDVHLLPRRNGEYFLYSGEIQPATTDPPAATDAPVHRALSHARRVYESVSGRRRRQEFLLKSLGEIERVRIHHPSAISGAQARSVYDALIQAAIDKHGKWMVANAAAVLSELADLLQRRLLFRRKRRIRKLGEELGLVNLDEVY